MQTSGPIGPLTFSLFAPSSISFRFVLLKYTDDTWLFWTTSFNTSFLHYLMAPVAVLHPGSASVCLSCSSRDAVLLPTLSSSFPCSGIFPIQLAYLFWPSSNGTAFVNPPPQIAFITDLSVIYMSVVFKSNCILEKHRVLVRIFQRKSTPPHTQIGL